MKPNHLSGVVRIVRGPQDFNIQELEELAADWLKMNHYDLFKEWAYKNIQPRIIFEEFLDCGKGLPDDWKIFCFWGEPKYIGVHRGRFSEHKANYYDVQMNLLPLRIFFDHFQEKIEIPENLSEMLEISRKLSKGTDFIRVDLYNIKSRIVFGELTNYPGAGLEHLEPEEWNFIFGKHW
jgi:hypothetical protein